MSGDKIWVAKGTYKPTVGTDRSVSFQMKNGVEIYGGFAGAETSVSQRVNFAAGQVNETILSGNIGNQSANTDNCYHVVFNPSGLNSTSVLNGFTISGGHAEGDYPQFGGGGMHNNSSSPTITSCTFSNNSAFYGGGLYNENSSPAVSNCVFINNSAQNDGGAMFNCFESIPTVSRCTFSANSSDTGGGIANFNNSAFMVSSSIFIGNTANYGGGMNNYASPGTLTNCAFTGNKGKFGGGLGNNKSLPAIINCTFSGNSAENFGGGMYNTESAPLVQNTIFWGNYKSGDLSVSEIYGGTASNFTFCCIQGGSGVYADAGNIFRNPVFVDADGPDDTLGTLDDNLALQDKSWCIGVATASEAPATDILGITRGTPPDMGAYENILSSRKATVIFVRANAAGGNNGTSWSDAYTSLQPALNDALLYDQVWVAKGTYKPTSGTGRNVAFQMKNEVEIYGGFVGNETDISQRTVYGMGKANETILNGNIGDENVNTDNCYHVFYHPSALSLDTTAILDGFTISGGYADADGANASWDSYGNFGGGMSNFDSSPKINNCTFNNNSANDEGGGMYNRNNSSPLITNCTFSSNSVIGVTDLYNGGGGGISNCSNSSPVITNCTFSGNSSNDTSGDDESGGGGLLNEYNSSPKIDHCSFTGNFAEYNGGGILNTWNSAPVITNCIFNGNTANLGEGGGICNDHDTSPVITNCTISNNTADAGGGMFVGINASPAILNCTFTRNMATWAGGVYFYMCSPLTVINTIFWGDSNTGSSETEEIFHDDHAKMTNCCIQDGTVFYSGDGNTFNDPIFVDAANGNYHLTAGSSCISTGLDPAIGNSVPLTDMEGRVRPLGSGTDIGAYECYDDGSFPGELTEVSKPLAAGWSWFSLNVSDPDMTIANVLSSLNPSDGDYIKNQTVSATYYNGIGWFGELTQINPKEMYKIKLGKADVLLFQGIPVDPSTNPVAIQTGWNWVGFLPQYLQPITSALITINPAGGDYIKDQTTSSTYYSEFGWFGELNIMAPLNGYMLKSSHAGTLTYSAGEPLISIMNKKNQKK